MVIPEPLAVALTREPAVIAEARALATVAEVLLWP
jgi:hypothetical protein